MGRRPTRKPDPFANLLLLFSDDALSTADNDARWIERIRTAKPGSPYYRGPRDPITGAPLKTATLAQQRVTIGAPRDGKNQSQYHRHGSVDLEAAG